MYRSNYDGFSYVHSDPVFHDSIERGHSEPYPRDLEVIFRYLQAFPHKARCFVDVGAHIGTTIFPLLRRFRQCFAYEPQQENHAFLLTNLRENGLAERCVVKPVGCSDRRRVGSTTMHAGGNSGCFFFREASAEGDVGPAVCETMPLDEDPELEGQDIDFLKIDTEGHELFVLRGAERMIRRCRPLIEVELNGMSEKLFGISDSSTVAYLEQLGARPFATPAGGSNAFFYFPDVSLAVVTRTIFVLWTGTNEMPPIRRESMQTIPNARLVTPHNLSDFILASEPLHPAYKFLSNTHKADYLRTYLMHFYGGGYADLKTQRGSWEAAFARVEADEAAYASGYPEAKPGDIAHPDYGQHYRDLIGNGAYVFRPDTPLTREWYANMLSFLDSIYDKLSVNPARSTRDCAESGSGYPIEWNQMLGRIFHPLVYKYRDHVHRDLTPPSFVNYR